MGNEENCKWYSADILSQEKENLQYSTVTGQMIKRHITLVEVLAVVGVLGLMLSYTGFTWGSVYKTKVQLEKKQQLSISIEQTADKIRKFLSPFESDTKISSNSVKRGSNTISVVGNRIFLTDSTDSQTISLPKGSTLRFSLYRSALNEEMLLTVFSVKDGVKKRNYAIKSRLKP